MRSSGRDDRRGGRRFRSCRGSCSDTTRPRTVTSWRRIGVVLAPCRLSPLRSAAARRSGRHRLRRRALGSLFEQLDRPGKPSSTRKVTSSLTPVVSPGAPGRGSFRNEIVARCWPRAAVLARYRHGTVDHTPIAQAPRRAAARARRPRGAHLPRRVPRLVPPERLSPRAPLAPEPAFDDRMLAKLLQPTCSAGAGASNADRRRGKLVRVAPSAQATTSRGTGRAGLLRRAASSRCDARTYRRPDDAEAGRSRAPELVSFTTDMGPSSSNRIHNVHLMADFIDGTLVKPGQVFSFNRVVGPRPPSAASSRVRRSSARS